MLARQKEINEFEISEQLEALQDKNITDSYIAHRLSQLGRLYIE
jgi:hypothetical protein